MKEFKINKGILTIGGFKFKLDSKDIDQLSDLISKIILRRYGTDITNKGIIEVEIQRKLQLKLTDLLLSDKDYIQQTAFKKRCIRVLCERYNTLYKGTSSKKTEDEIRIGDIVQFYNFDNINLFGESAKNLINGIISGLDLKLGMKIKQDDYDHLYYYQKKDTKPLNSYI